MNAEGVRKATRTMLILVVALGIASIGTIVARRGLGHHSLFGFVDFFDLNEEQSLGTWVTAMAFAAAAVLATLCARTDDARRRGWWLLAVALLVISIDEVGTVHEGVDNALENRFEAGGALRYLWVIPGALIVVAFAGVQLRFLRSLERDVRSRLIVAAVVWVVGAIGLEVVEGAVIEGPGGGEATVGSELVAVTQELVELLGIALAIQAIGLALASRWPETQHAAPAG